MPQHRVAFALLFHHNAHRKNVINLVKTTALCFHLLMNRVVVFRPASHHGFKTHLG